MTRIPESKVRVVRLPYRRYESPDLMEVGRITPIRALPAGQRALPEFQQALLPEFNLHHYVPVTFGNSRMLQLPAPEGTQLTLFKKGGKVKKIRKCEDGLPGYAQGLDLGIRFDDQGNIVTIDPVAGLPKEPTIAEIDRAIQLREASKTATPAAKLKSGNTSGNGESFTQGSDKKAPYNWKPLGFMLGEYDTSVASAIIGANKTKKAADLTAEASKTFTPYESGTIYSDQHIGRSEDAAYKVLDNQAPLVSNDPSLQRAYEFAKAKERGNIANNANAQRSAGITAYNQEEAQRKYRNRVRGAENQQSARRAELQAESQKKLIDATTQQSIAQSTMGVFRDLRKEDLYNTAEKNTQVAQDAQAHAEKILKANITTKYGATLD